MGAKRRVLGGDPSLSLSLSTDARASAYVLHGKGWHPSGRIGKQFRSERISRARGILFSARGILFAPPRLGRAGVYRVRAGAVWQRSGEAVEYGRRWDVWSAGPAMPATLARCMNLRGAGRARLGKEKVPAAAMAVGRSRRGAGL